MNLEVGSVLKGKVTGIAKFGAFVTLAPNVSGLVHISEVANTFVNNIEDFLTVGQEVDVKVLSVDGNKRINLSIKQAAPDSGGRGSGRQDNPRRTAQPRQSATETKPAADTAKPAVTSPAAMTGESTLPKSGNQAFEDSLKKFLQEADSKISESGRYERQRGSRKRNGRR